MSFQLSPEVDKNKIFLVKLSELEGRLDPFYYTTNFKEYTLTPLKKIARVKGGKRIPKGQAFAFTPTQFRYIRVQDITKDNVNINLLKSISEKLYNFLVRYEVENEDLIMSIAGTVGKTIIFRNNTDKKTILTENAAKIVLTSTDITSEFLHVALQTSLVQQQIQASYIQTTIPKLGLDKILNLKIPIPPKEIQTQIVAKMDTAYATKKQKEAEAQRLLDGIDGYLLGELGIELPAQAENTLQSRIFTRQLSEVSGGRFDAPAHQKQYVLETRKYLMDKFRNSVLINPPTSFLGLSPDTMATFIPMNKVSDQYGDADTSDCKILGNSEGYTKFQEEDLLWAKITPCMQNGKSAVASGLSNNIGFGSTEFHVFRARQGVNIRYIHGLLRLRSLRKHAVMYFAGSAGHQRVSDNFFKNLSIPLPPLEKQIEIANHITKIRTHAKLLQQQAKTGLEQAKKEVEAMILGEDASNKQ